MFWGISARFVILGMFPISHSKAKRREEGGEANRNRARIPQILKNYRDKSCEGLALLFFVLSLMGNITYGLGILFHSLERQYVLNNLPWLIGSIGTMFEDAVIFAQFRMYAKKEEERDGAAVEA